MLAREITNCATFMNLLVSWLPCTLLLQCVKHELGLSESAHLTSVRCFILGAMEALTRF